MGCSPSGPGDLSVCSFCSFSKTNSVLKHMVSFQVVFFRNCWYTGQIFYCVYFFRCFVTSDYMVYYSRGLLYFRIKYIYSFKQFTSTSIQCIVPIVRLSLQFITRSCSQHWLPVIGPQMHCTVCMQFTGFHIYFQCNPLDYEQG